MKSVRLAQVDGKQPLRKLRLNPEGKARLSQGEKGQEKVLAQVNGNERQHADHHKLGLGGKIGRGNQYMSWIAVDDVTGAILHCLADSSLAGPVNFVAPRAVTNLEFTKTLGRVLGRPTIFPMPALAARAAFGQMGQELLLGGQRVEPARLLGSGYAFKFPELEPALRHVLGK